VAVEFLGVAQEGAVASFADGAKDLADRGKDGIER
jgi:hypothetical protein